MLQCQTGRSIWSTSITKLQIVNRHTIKSYRYIKIVQNCQDALKYFFNYYIPPLFAKSISISTPCKTSNCWNLLTYIIKCSQFPIILRACSYSVCRNCSKTTICSCLWSQLKAQKFSLLQEIYASSKNWAMNMNKRRELAPTADVWNNMSENEANHENTKRKVFSS